MNRLSAISARLGSIPPSKLNGLPKSVQKLIEEDLPLLLNYANHSGDHYSPDCGCTGCETYRLLFNPINDVESHVYG